MHGPLEVPQSLLTQCDLSAGQDKHVHGEWKTFASSDSFFVAQHQHCPLNLEWHWGRGPLQFKTQPNAARFHSDPVLNDITMMTLPPNLISMHEE